MEDAVEESVDSGLLDPRQKRIHDCKEGCSVAIKVLKAWWKLLVLVLTPFVLLPFPLALSPLADDQVCAVLCDNSLAANSALFRANDSSRRMHSIQVGSSVVPLVLDTIATYVA